MTQKSLLVKNIAPGLAEVGKIKIGEKGRIVKDKDGKPKFQLPVKLDHFKIKKLERGDDNNFIEDVELQDKILADTTNKSLKSIPVYLLFDEIEKNIQSRYVCFYKGSLFCSGDGERAEQITKDPKLRKTQPTEERNCPCEKLSSDWHDPKSRCKLSMCLSVMIPASEHLGGIYKFRSTSYNSYKQLIGSMLMIKQFAGQRLAGILMNLVVGPKTVQTPDGKNQKANVVSLEFAGTMEDLRSKALAWAESDAKFQIDMKKKENEVKLIMSSDGAILGDTDDFVEEFVPDAVDGETVEASEETENTAGKAPPKRTRRTKEEMAAARSESARMEKAAGSEPVSAENINNSSSSASAAPTLTLVEPVVEEPVVEEPVTVVSVNDEPVNDEPQPDTGDMLDELFE